MAGERLRTAAAIAALAVLGLAVTHTIDLWLLDRDPPWLEAGNGSSVFELMATATVALCAAAAALLAWTWPERRRLLAPLAAGLALVFLVDAFALTDDFGAAGDGVLVALLAVVFVLLWSYARAAGTGGATIWVGLLLLGLSVAIRAADPVFSALGWEHGDVAYEAKVVVKHGSELAGWILVAFGLVPEAFSRISQAQDRGAAARAAGSG